MRWEDEFDSHWGTFSEQVEHRVRKEWRDGSDALETLANDIARAEAEKWRDPGYPPGAWLRTLKDAYPDVGRRFDDALDGLSLTAALPKPATDQLKFIGISGGASALVSFLFGFVAFDAALVAAFLLMVVFAAMVMLGVRWWFAWREGQSLGNAIQRIREELEAQGRRLLEIVQWADANPQG